MPSNIDRSKIVWDEPKKNSGIDPSLVEWDTPDPKVAGLQLSDTTTPGLDAMPIANRTSGQGTASFSARYASNAVDEPELKLKILADDLMPGEPDRYDRIGYVDGNVVYLGKDGSPYVASSRTIGQKAKDLGANLTAHAPSIIGGAGGAMLGPAGSATGAMAGRGIEKFIASTYGQEFDASRDLTDIAQEGFLAYGSDLMGRALARFLQGRAARKIASDVDLGLSVDDAAERFRYNAKDDFGIDVLPHEATDSAYMRDRFKVAQRANPQAGQLADDFAKNRAGQVDDSLEMLNEKLRLPNGSDRKLRGKAYDNARELRNKFIERRDAGSSKYYQQASQYNITDDEFVDVWEKIAAELGDVATDTNQGRVLRSIENKFFEGNNPVLNVGKLHNIKLELDAMLNGEAKVAADKVIQGKITRIQKELTDTLSNSNPLYRKGREEFIRLSGQLDNFDKTIVGEISRAKSPADVAKKIFGDGGKNDLVSAADVRLARRYFDPETWDGIIKAHISNALDSTKGLVESKGFKFRDMVFGSKKQQAALAAALGDERYQILNGYMDILDRTRKTFSGESGTAFFQQAKDEMVDLAIGRTTGGKMLNTVEKVSEPLSIPKNMTKAKKREMWDKYAIEFMEAVLSADPKTALQNLKRLKYSKPGTEKWIASLATGLGISVVDATEILTKLPKPEDQLEGRTQQQQ